MENSIVNRELSCISAASAKRRAARMMMMIITLRGEHWARQWLLNVGFATINRTHISKATFLGLCIITNSFSRRAVNTSAQIARLTNCDAVFDYVNDDNNNIL